MTNIYDYFNIKRRDISEKLLANLIKIKGKTSAYTEIGYNYVIKNEYLNGLKLGKLLGEGVYGFVYEVDGYKYAIKILEIDTADEHFGNNFETEIDIYRNMSDLEIAPKFIDSWIAEVYNKVENNILQFGFLLTEKYDISLFNYVKTEHNKIPVTIINTLINKVNLIHDNGYVHCDLHPRNIMIDREGDNITNIGIIDFGLSFHIDRIPSTETLNSYILHNEVMIPFGVSDSDPIKVLMAYDTIHMLHF